MQPSKVFHNLTIDSNLWSYIGNAHIYLTKNVCAILKKLVSSFCCKFSNFERQNAICSHGHAIASENNLQPRLWDSKDNSAPILNSFNSFKETRRRLKTAPHFHNDLSFNIIF